MDLQVEEFDKEYVELLPDDMEMVSDTELTQYFIQTWSLDYYDHGAINNKFNLLLLQLCFTQDHHLLV